MADLTPKQEKAIAALMSSATIAEAAHAAHIGERTLYAWLDDPAFSEAYRAARREAVAQSTARLQQASSAAVDTLVALLASSRPSIQLGAARSILEFAIGAVELEDMQQRLTALEERIEQKL